jgi:ABC-type branched-subunit amino acid transport system ATPase component
MAILTLKQLSVRFGGLTAVNAVDCAVEPGQIFSIIGPNGAGKTTVFNTISGIYQPASGVIEFDGPPLERPFKPSIALAALASGLIAGLVLMALAADVDGLWRATIKRNYLSPDIPFSYAAAWLDFQVYFHGDLAIEHRGKRWKVVTADGRRQLANVADEAAALATRDRLQAILSALADNATGEVRETTPGSFNAMIGERSLPLGDFAGAALAQRQLDALHEIAAAQPGRTNRIWAALALGFVVGSAGVLSVWRRARRTPEVVALAGICRTFQNIRLFQNMTVLDNVLTACDRRLRCGALSMALRTPAVRSEEASAFQAALDLLKFVGLDRDSSGLAKNLPYGDQRRLEIARALATEPRLLLLDEPAAGMNPAESNGLTQLIGKIRDRGVTVLLIEHHMRLVMDISDRIAVLDYGVKIAEGTPQEVRANPEVVKAYLGDEEVS